MTWGEFKAKVDEELAKAGCDDTAEIDYIDVGSVTYGSLDVHVEKSEEYGERFVDFSVS